MNTTAYLCIGCPLGCRLEVDESDQHEIVQVRGFSCKRGKDFAIQEHRDPRRMVSTTVRLAGGSLTRLPVRTAAPVPKDQVLPLCRSLTGITVSAPVRMGDTIVRNALGLGVDVIATRDA
ncbi:MAG TPA: DUF1667 domain-containing protein [Deinococcales bacterium]|nr:DUF1667 domain-containing protein [Deinococcales bacterium]